MTEPNYPEVPPTAPLPPTGPPTFVSPFGPPPTTEAVSIGGGDGGGRRVPARALAIGLGVVALAGGTAFAVQSFGGGESGAATPEEAATRLVDAIAAEDVLGVIDLLPEGERDLLRDLTTDARDEYQRLGVLSDTFSLDGFNGVDIVAEDVEVDVDEITDGLAMVTITDGEFSVEVDGDELTGNLGEVVEAVADERDAEIEVDDTEDEADAEELAASFAVVEEDGRWHPSLAFTAAELARQSSFDDDGNPLDEPDLTDGVEPEGADDPEAAVQALIDAGASLDAEDAIAILDPGEARALQIYSQYFLPIDDADLPEDLEIEAELTEAEVDDLGGGANRVVPTGFELRFESEDGDGEVVLEDGCVNVDIRPADEDDGEPLDEEFCFAEDGEPLPDEVGDVEVPEELQEVAEAFLPLRFGIVTVQRDGEHFVAPIRTLGDAILGLTRGLEREDLEEGGAVFALLAGDLDDEVEELFDQAFESSLGFEEEFEFDEDAFGDEVEDDCEGVGCGFDEEEVEPEFAPRTETGASGPNGELQIFDVVAGSVAEDGTATFTAIADIDGEFVIGVQGEDGLDSVVTVFDAATGEELGFNDDFSGVDPEVLVSLAGGQVVNIEVRGFAGAGGDFLVYFEPFE